MVRYPLALAGFSGSGKSTVGRLTGKITGVSFVDLDGYLESLLSADLSPARNKLSEQGFRELESLALSRFAACGGVLALNSGCVTPIKNRRILSLGFRIYFLDAPFDVLYARISGTARQVCSQLSKRELQRLWELRRPLYLGLADRVLDARKSPDVLAECIARDAGYG